MSTNKEVFKSLPAVDKLLCSPEVCPLIEIYGRELVTFSIRHTIDSYRKSIQQGNPPPVIREVIDKIKSILELSGNRSLKRVINASGIIIHTNLGRSPFGDKMIEDSIKVLKSYNNLEFNLKTGVRGNRNDHASGLLKFLTGAEDVLVVNNNAAAVMMILRAFARKKEVIVSRGELIEIGGSFRIPEIMAASDCKMVEVGTTNKTSIEDYRNAITIKTGLLFKAHKSNYIIKGFTKEVELKELSDLGKEKNIPVLYDLGSGLLRKNSNKLLKDEPDVREALESGVDLVCFSGDKLLGGPQAGIIAGKKLFIDKLKKEPMLRALRVCKLTLAFLETACLYYLNEKELNENNLTFKTFNRKTTDIKKTAELLRSSLEKSGIKTEIINSTGQCGGGTLPDAEIESYTVMIKQNSPNKQRSDFSEKFHQALLDHSQPVLAILKKGNIYFDMLTIYEKDVEELSNIIVAVNKTIA
jgi:L-seryl-tRNA(Ser) seleniumtransferase